MSLPGFASPFASALALLGVALVIVPAHADGSDKGGQNRVSAAPDAAAPIVVTVATDKKTYTIVEPIKFVMTVRNTTKAPLTLAFSSGQKYDFEIKHGSNPQSAPVWQWSRGMMFAQMLSRTSLAPGKTLTFTETFDPKKSNVGKPISLTPGSYTVVATLTTMPRTARPLGSATFSVKP